MEAGGRQRDNDQLGVKVLRMSVATARTDRIAMSDLVRISPCSVTAIIDRDDMHA
jgi:hypothetical protein